MQKNIQSKSLNWKSEQNLVNEPDIANTRFILQEWEPEEIFYTGFLYFRYKKII